VISACTGFEPQTIANLYRFLEDASRNEEESDVPSAVNFDVQSHD
jgi:hypothetical protein